jgi:DNA-binding transcriptional regulator PaaX
MRRTEGATLYEIFEVTGWLLHSVRAALTDLRKAGHQLEKTKRDETTCYRIVESA